MRYTIIAALLLTGCFSSVDDWDHGADAGLIEPDPLHALEDLDATVPHTGPWQCDCYWNDHSSAPTVWHQSLDIDAPDEDTAREMANEEALIAAKNDTCAPCDTCSPRPCFVPSPLCGCTRHGIGEGCEVLPRDGGGLVAVCP